MKILVSSKNKNEIDERFGRAVAYNVYDTETKETEYSENASINEAHGAGISAAQNAIDLGVEVILTGHLGPKASSVLAATKIKSYKLKVGTIKENIDKYLDGELELISVEGPTRI